MILVLEAYIPHITGKPDKRASSDQGKVEDFVDENGIRTTVEYAMTEEGKKVKVWNSTIHGKTLLTIL